MENKEFAFKGLVLNGFLMLFVNIAVLLAIIAGFGISIMDLNATDGEMGGWMLAGGCILLIVIQLVR